ncbi:MAG TPA: type I DNA topoisomerase [Flavobacteriales bacterium]|nr:type I DNA topoisomerase [Flavobacteriales bacterium]
MAKNLVIVESPAKAKTIEGFLGEGYKVKSCFGHVRDLLTKKLSVDVDNHFLPTYEIPEDKKKVVNDLKKEAQQAELVWLATDEDREGEAISWHLVQALELSDDKIRRIVFHEITKTAILRAIENPRGINQELVNAQQARRVLDRLVGYEISPVLWKKVKPSLSAGRVQSVAVRLIVDREREIKSFESNSYYKVVAEFTVDSNGTGNSFKAELPKRLNSIEEARALLEQCSHSSFSVENLEVKPSKKSPTAPFTTSTLQQEASRKMGYSVAQTMVVAQKLYEAGKITYMRTDSVNLSDLAVSAAEDEVRNSYGDQYVNPRVFSTKSKGAQEAHEAIRPTYMQNRTVDGDSSEQKLYELIWKRTLASQMSDAQLEKTTATINISGSDEKFIARGEVIKFDGFLKVYLESTDNGDTNGSAKESKGLLPPLPVGASLSMEEINATERFTKHPPRYTEASLVKKMEDLGIGRPSTYAPTISTIQRREYVVKEDREGTEREFKFMKLKFGNIESGVGKENTGFEKSKLFPADIGMVVTDFLVEHFGNVLDYNFTANVEREFDQIAEGQKEWNEMIQQFYAPFHKEVEQTTETGERASGERELGIDPDSGKPVIVRIGRYGAMAQIGHRDEEDKPKFASLLKDQSIETITLEEALELFKLPRSVGEYEGKEIVAAIGRFGPYVRHDGKFYSLKKDDDPMTVSVERSIELIEAKRKADKDRIILSFSENKDVQVLNGRYGPFIKIEKNNYKIPKDKDPATLTLAECLEIAENAPPKKGRGYKKKN